MDLEEHLRTLRDTPLLEAIRHLFDQEAARIAPPSTPIAVYVAGGAAVHYWTRARVTGDVDAEFAGRYFPGDEVVLYQGDDGATHPVYIDRQFNPMFALLHEDYQRNAVGVWGRLGGGRAFDVRVLAPLDLAISKLARWAENDQEDVMELARQGLLDPDELEAKAREALATAVGLNASMVGINITEAVDHVRRLRATPGP